MRKRFIIVNDFLNFKILYYLHAVIYGGICVKKIYLLLLFFILSIFISTTIYAQSENTMNEYGQNVGKASSVTNFQDWVDFGEKQNVDLQKSWTITFNQTVTFKKIVSAEIEDATGELIPVNLEMLDKQKLKISPTTRYLADKSYTLRVKLTNGLRYKLSFHTTENVDTLVEPIGQALEAQLVKVPAMPEKGFNFPYYIRIPSTKYMTENNGDKRYIMFDMVNSGVSNMQTAEAYVKKALLQQTTFSVKVSEKLWAPLIMPVIPRSHVHYYDKNNELNAIYEHAFDRDTAFLNEILTSSAGGVVRAGYEKLGLRADDFVNLDEQVLAMFEYATHYLNTYSQQVEQEQMFMAGFSASGTFVDRVSMLHPDKVKAVASGATLDDMMLPLSEYNGEKLVFPIGIADYEALTGKTFQIKDVNSMAKVVFMGAEDQNDTLAEGFSDSYSATERKIVGNAFGFHLLQRAQLLIQLYAEAGGEAKFIIEEDTGHFVSQQMIDYLVRFFAANRDAQNPVYFPFTK